MAAKEQIEAVRGFTRFYTGVMGLLNQRIYNKDYTLAQVRLMFELHQAENCTANDLAAKLKLDKGYVSRMLQGLENKGLLSREVSAEDRRNKVLSFTKAGQEEVLDLIDKSNQETAELLSGLNEAQCRELTAAMGQVQNLLGSKPQPAVPEIREARDGEAGLVIHFYYQLFKQQFGLKPCVEQYFVHTMNEYFEAKPHSRLWVAEQSGHIAASICVVKTGEHEAQLRLFAADPALQGHGLGKKMLSLAMDYCKAEDFSHVILWTVDFCEAARHLYAKFGFKLTETKPNDLWADHEVIEELWEYQA